MLYSFSNFKIPSRYQNYKVLPTRILDSFFEGSQLVKRYFISTYMYYFSSLLIGLVICSFPNEKNPKLKGTTFLLSKMAALWV